MKKKAIFYLVIEFEAGVSTSKFISVANFGLFYDKIFTYILCMYVQRFFGRQVLKTGKLLDLIFINLIETFSENCTFN